MLLDGVVELVDRVPAVVEREAAAEDLHPQMVLLVDHQAQVLVVADADAARAVRLGMLAADELPLDEELAVEVFEVGDVDVAQLGVDPELVELRAERFFDLRLGVVVGPVGEGELGQVPRQADAAGDDDVGLGTGPAQPLAAGVRQGVNIHARSPWLPVVPARRPAGRPLVDRRCPAIRS